MECAGNFGDGEQPAHSHISPFYPANDLSQIVVSRRFVAGRFAKDHSLPQFSENPEAHADPGANIHVTYGCDETGFDSPNLQNLISPHQRPVPVIVYKSREQPSVQGKFNFPAK